MPATPHHVDEENHSVLNENNSNSNENNINNNVPTTTTTTTTTDHHKNSKLPLIPMSLSHQQRRDVMKSNLTTIETTTAATAAAGEGPSSNNDNNNNRSRLNNLRNNNSLYSSKNGTSGSSDTNSSSDDNDDDNKFGIDDLSIQLSETARLERMMNKFDLLTSSNSNSNVDGTTTSEGSNKTESESESESETPRALNDVVKKFDSFQSSSPSPIKDDDPNFRVVVRATVAGDDDDMDDEGEGIEITATTSSGDDDNDDDDDDDTNNLNDNNNNNNNNNNSPTSTNTGSSSSTMGVDLEQFRIASSHTHDTIGDGISIGIGSGLSRTMLSSSPPHNNNNNTKLLEEHIITLMSQVSSLQTKNDVLHSQLRVQHTEDVQDMYHDPFSSPSKNGRGGLSNSAMGGFTTSTFLSKIDDAAAVAAGGTSTTSTTTVEASTTSTTAMAVSSSVLPVFDSNSDLFHRELTELRMRNQSLQNELDLSKQTQERLKINLKSVEKQDKQKFDYLSALSKELNESTTREKSLRDELDACRVRLEGYEMVCGNNDDNSGSDNSSVEGGEEGEKKKSKNNKKKRKKKKKNSSSSSSSLSSSSVTTSSMTNDVATALVVSTKQNEALVAHNTELELQNKKLNKQCNDLESKYGLIEPKGPDATNSAKQLYTRYIEMKSSLSSLAVVLEEVQEQNSMLNKRIIQLETELKIAKDDGNNDTQHDDDEQQQQQQQLHDDISNLTVLLEEVQEQNTVLNERIVQLEKELNDAQQQQPQSSLDPTAGAGTADRPVCLPRIVAPSFDEAISRTISKEQEETLKILVNDLEVQITDYRDMEQRHEVVRVEFESSIDKLVQENTDLRKALDVKLQQQSDALSSTTTTDADADAPVDERREVKQQKQQPDRELKKLRKELQNCMKELDSRITVEKSTELLNALQSSRDAMDDASAESSELLNEMEGMLKSSQKELKNERIKFKQLEAKCKDLSDLTLKRDGDNAQLETLLSTTKKDLLAEQGKIEELNRTLTALYKEINSLKMDLDKTKSVAANRNEEMDTVEELNATILSLQDKIKQMKNELEQKLIKIVKSEERVTKKHERAKELAASNASLCEGIKALKGHLATINDEASKTEVMLGTTKKELNLKREKVGKLEVTNGSLRTELDVLKTCIDETTDKGSTENIELTASLAASKKEFKMERKRREEISKEKRDLEALLHLTKEDLNTQLHTEKEKNKKLDAEISCLQNNVDSLTLVIAAATKRMEKMDDAESKESTNLQGIVDSTNELLSAERAKVEELVTAKSSLQVELDSAKKNIEELSASNATLKDDIEAIRRDTSNDTAETSLQFNELEKLLATTQEELNEEEKQVETLEGQVDDLTMQIQNHEKCQKDLQTSLDDVKEEIQTVRAKKSEFEELLSKKNQELGDLNTKLQNLESLKLEITKQSETVASDLGIATKEKAELISKVLGLECSHNETLEEVERLSNEKLDITKKSESLSIDLDNVSKENTELLSTAAALKEEKDSLASLTKSLQTKQKVLAEAYAAREAAAMQVVLAKEALSTENAELVLTVSGLEFEKDNLMKSLKKKVDALVELESTKEALSAEKKRANNMASQLDAASTDVRLREAEMMLGTTKVKLEDALRTNNELSENVRVLESSAEESQTSHELTLKVSESMYSEILKQYEETKTTLETDAQMLSSLESQIVSIREEKESLLKRTAALARRDQIQKASLNTSNEEIGKLMTTIDNFQDRFQSLANQIQKVQAEKEDLVKEHEQKEQRLIADMDAPQEYLQKLQTECDEIRAREVDMKSKFVQTLTKHQSSWMEERDSLNKRITDLDKQRIECEAELKACRDKILNRDKIIAKVQGDALAKFVALQGAQQISKDALEREKELQLKYDSCLQDLETQQIKKVELRAVDIEKEKDLQSKHDSCVQDLKAQLKVTNNEKEELQTKHDSCLQEQEYFKSQLIITNDEKEELQSKHDSLEKELETIRNSKTGTIEDANNSNDISKKLEENKKALESVTDELNEAHIREGVLEESLSSCQEELSACKELIAKLNKSNEILEMKNKNLTESLSKFDASNGGTNGFDSIVEENDSLRSEKVILDRELQECTKERDSLKESARAFDEARDDDNNFKGVDAEKIKQENSMMKELLAKSQSAVSEAKTMQKVLSKEIESSSNREGHLKKKISMLRTQNEDMEKRLDDQEKELDEFENDFSMARDDARKVVEELRSQLLQLERRNQQLMADSTVGKVEDLKNKLRQLIQQNKRLQNEIEFSKVREGRLESQLGLEPRRKKKGEF